jgi:hypothetical protein
MPKRFSTVVPIGVFLGMWFCSVATAEESTLVFEGKALRESFAQNSLRISQELQGKHIVVNDMEISKISLREVTLARRDHNPKLYIECGVTDDSVEHVSRLNTGEHITISGSVDEVREAFATPAYVVFLSNCNYDSQAPKPESAN